MDKQGREIDRVEAELEAIVRTNETPPPLPANNKGPAH
jgi:hypothetical protein